MATIHVDTDLITISLSRFERIAGLLRDQTIPLDSVVSVAVEPNPLVSARGMRAPGLGVPGRTKIGTWRRGGRRELVVVRRGEPAVSIEATGQRFDRYLVGTPDAEAIAERIRSLRPTGETQPS